MAIKGNHLRATGHHLPHGIAATSLIVKIYEYTYAFILSVIFQLYLGQPVVKMPRQKFSHCNASWETSTLLQIREALQPAISANFLLK